MKKTLLLLLLLFLLPSMSVKAQDYTLKSGKSQSGSYNETDYNYYKATASKNGYIAITAKTSNKSSLLVDICNVNKEVIATDISIKNKETVLHKAKKGTTYYIRIKGVQGVNYSILYKTKTIETLTYAKKYTFTFTNASFNNEKNGISLKIKTNRYGVLNVMGDVNDPITLKYLNSKKKSVSKNEVMFKKTLTGIGVQSNRVYYVKMWKPEDTNSGTTTLTNIKYQIKDVDPSNISSKGKAKTIYSNKFASTLVPAGKTTTSWYRFKVTRKKKISITVESRMLQNNGKCLQLYICNSKGKKINSKSIKIDGVATAKSKGKKYIMKYPSITLTTSVAFPTGTYYLKVTSGTKTSSGSYRIKWK